MHSPTPQIYREANFVFVAACGYFRYSRTVLPIDNSVSMFKTPFLSAVRDPIGDATARVLIGFHALSGADINWLIVRKWQDIMLEGFSNAGIQQC